MHLRLATLDDIPALSALITESAQGLSADYYSERQIAAAIRYVFGVDTQLIHDGTYWAVEEETQLLGCGGWSFRQTLYGGNQMKASTDPRLDPATDPARIRAFFVHPDHARRGIGKSLLTTCLAAAKTAGFHTVELMATLPGVPLYEAFGFIPCEAVITTLPDGTDLPFVRMARALATQA